MKKVLLSVICMSAIIFGRFTNGDRVAWIGDSITRGGLWHSAYIWSFYATRYPTERIYFANKGISGDKASGAPPRMWEITNFNPNRAVIMYGMNDIGRATYGNDDFEMQTIWLTRFSNFMNVLITDLKANNYPITLIMPSIFEDKAINGGSVRYVNLPASTYTPNDGLRNASYIVSNLSVARSTELVNIYFAMNKINSNYQFQTSLYNSIVGADRVHPGNEGRFIMAMLFLLSQDVSRDVAFTKINVMNSEINTTNAIVSVVSNNRLNFISFTYSPKALPFPIDDKYTWAEENNLLKVSDLINKEIVLIQNLEQGSYEVKINATSIGFFSNAELATGINIGKYSNTPQNKKSQTLLSRFKDRDLLEAEQIRFIQHGRILMPEECRTNLVLGLNFATNYILDNPGTSFNANIFAKYLIYAPNEASILATMQSHDDFVYANNNPGSYQITISKKPDTGFRTNAILHLMAGKCGVRVNERVSNWIDLSSDANSVVQPDPDKQPILTTNTIGGRPALYFDGTNDSFTLPSRIVLDTDYTLFVVLTMRNLKSSFTPVISSSKEAYGRGTLGVWGNSSLTDKRFYWKDSLADGGFMPAAAQSANINEFDVLCLEKFASGTNTITRLTKNNISVLGSNANSRDWGGGLRYIESIAASDLSPLGPEQAFNGHIYEILCFNRILDSDEKLDWFSQLTNRYYRSPSEIPIVSFITEGSMWVGYTNSTIHGYASSVDSVISRVEVSLDLINWVNAIGTNNWHTQLPLSAINSNIIYARSVSTNGIMSDVKSIIINIDTTPPIVLLTNTIIQSEISNIHTYVGSITEDESALSGIWYSTNNGFSYNSMKNMNPWTLSIDTRNLENGPFTLIMRASNSVGHVSTITISNTIFNLLQDEKKIIESIFSTKDEKICYGEKLLEFLVPGTSGKNETTIVKIMNSPGDSLFEKHFSNTYDGQIIQWNPFAEKTGKVSLGLYFYEIKRGNEIKRGYFILIQ